MAIIENKPAKAEANIIGRRILADLIDILIYVGSITLITFLLFTWFGHEATILPTRIFIGILIFSLCARDAFGASVGKKIVSLCVVYSRSSKKCDLQASLLRNIPIVGFTLISILAEKFMPSLLFVVLTIEFLLIVLTSKSIGDRVSKTYVTTNEKFNNSIQPTAKASAN